jgi:glycosyltransferase involved in cell wall biosynthesis
MNKPNDIGIISFVPDYWGEQYQSRHHILKGLSARYKILWVSPPSYFINLTISDFSNYFIKKRVTKVSSSLWCYTPKLPADYKPKAVDNILIALCFRLYNNIWKFFYVFRIKKMLKKHGIKKAIIYIWRPEFSWVLRFFKSDLICYHIDDEYSFDSKKDNEISLEELKLLEESDLVFIHSKSLFRKKGQVNPNTFLVPNGVDFDFFRSKISEDRLKMTDISNVGFPRIGYVGYIKRHLDLDLLIFLAAEKKEWNFILVGPVRDEHEEIKESLEILSKFPNVFFIGAKPYKDIPNIINDLDVCLMPYLSNHYTKHIYPLKMHEYFACGKPVVSTELENVIDFSDCLLIARSDFEWLVKIQDALELDNSSFEDKRIEIAKANSWQSRILQISKLIEEQLKLAN